MEKDFIIAGFGGQGVLLAGEVLANGFMLDDKKLRGIRLMERK